MNHVQGLLQPFSLQLLLWEVGRDATLTPVGGSRRKTAFTLCIPAATTLHVGDVPLQAPSHCENSVP